MSVRKKRQRSCPRMLARSMISAVDSMKDASRSMCLAACIVPSVVLALLVPSVIANNTASAGLGKQGAGSFPAVGFLVNRMTVFPTRIGSRALTLPMEGGLVYSFCCPGI
jgi:hypothetical protein